MNHTNGWTLHVHPAILLRWLGRRDVDRRIVLLDLEPDVLLDGQLLLDINAVFNPLVVRRGFVQRADYYVGCTGARIELEARFGVVKAVTGESRLDVDYRNTVARKQASGGTLRPAFSADAEGLKASLELGEARYDTDQEVLLEASYRSSERSLVVTNLGSLVRWELRIPRGERVVSDFLEGNLYLRGTCAWSGNTRTGEVSVRPSEVQVFTPDRRPMKPNQSLAMFYVLWRAGLLVHGRDGSMIGFRLESEP